MLIAHPGAEMYGSDRVLLDAAVGFAEAGWIVRVVIPGGGPLFDALTDAGIDVQILPTLVLRKALMKPTGWPKLISGVTAGSVRIAREMRAFAPDLVYVSTITQPLWAPVARARRVPVLVHVHEAEASAHPLVRKALYAPVRAASSVIVNSGFVRRTMLASYASLDARAVFIPNPVPGPAVPVAPRPELGGELRVGYVGRLSPRKGVDVAVSAVGALVADGIDARLDLIGAVFEGYEWYEDELRALIDTLGIADRVTFHGFVDSVWDAVSGVDVVVVPSRADEPFGNTAVEGVLALRPVIASDTSGLREATAGVPTTMLVQPDSAEALRAALADVAARWPDIAAKTDDAASIVRARHDVEAFRFALTGLAGRTLADSGA